MESVVVSPGGTTKVLLRAAPPGHPTPAAGAVCHLHYTGTLRDGGEEFDSSRGQYADTKGGITVLKKKRPFKFVVGRGEVIKGWDAAVASMHLGERARVTVPAAEAYGDAGAGDGKIPPGADLVFDMELLGVDKQFYVPEEE